MTELDSQWSDLDAAAIANLSGFALERFYEYRDQLRSEGRDWCGDAQQVLSGYIWDNSDGCEADE